MKRNLLSNSMNRRQFITGLVAAGTALAAFRSAGATTALPSAKYMLLGTGTEQGISRFLWNAETGELTADGVAAAIKQPSWIALGPERKYLYAACEVPSFDGRPTGGVVSFAVSDGKLTQLSRAASAGGGTCQCAIDGTGHVLVSADYGNGSAASFHCVDGRVSEHVWSDKYSGSGPVAARQEAPHAHFASFSPDNRFAYINDLGTDCIHIYSVDATTAKLKSAGTFRSHPGAGPRTLHFHPNGHSAYVMNELDSTVDVVEWKSADGSLTKTAEINLLPAAYKGETRGCDTVITQDGKFAYFANRDNNFLYSFHADVANAQLTPIARTPTGGKTARHLTLDATERWMLVANQDSDCIAVFARNPQTGELASTGKTFKAKAPMCMVFV